MKKLRLPKMTPLQYATACVLAESDKPTPSEQIRARTGRNGPPFYAMIDKMIKNGWVWKIKKPEGYTIKTLYSLKPEGRRVLEETLNYFQLFSVNGVCSIDNS